MLGMLSPASRGALMTSGIFLYVFMGLIAGYFSARLYKTMKGREWKKGAFLTATLYPGIVFGTCFFLNFFIWDKHSSGAVPFSTMIWLLCLWFGISVPLVYLGYYFGYRKHPYQHPVRTNMIPRQVPTQVRMPRCTQHFLFLTFNNKKMFLFRNTALVYESTALCDDGGNSTIWSCFHRAVLCVHSHLAESILLSVRFPFLSILHIGCELRSNIHCDDILPAMWRGTLHLPSNDAFIQTRVFILQKSLMLILKNMCFFLLFVGLSLVVA